MKVMRSLLVLSILAFSLNASYAQLVNIESRRMQADSIRFSGNANLTFNHQQTNDIILNVFKSTVSAQAKSKNLRHNFLILGDYALTRSNSNTISNVGFSHLRYNYKWTKWLTWEAYTQLQFNELLSLRYRYLVGTGARFQLSYGDIVKTYIGISTFYEYELIQDAGLTNNSDLRMSNYFTVSIKFPKKRGEFASTTYYQPLLKYWADYRLTTQSMIQLNITEKLSFITSVNYFFDFNPPEGIRPSTLSLTNGLRFTF